MNQLTEVVKHLLAINVIAYLAAYIFFGNEQVASATLGLYYPGSANFQGYQLVTHMFMHGGLMHLLFNMMMLYFLGPWVERALGPKRFLLLYFVAGFGAILLHLVIAHVGILSIGADLEPQVLQEIFREGRDVMLRNQKYRVESWNTINGMANVPMVGASGALFGVLIAFAYMYPNTQLMLLFPPIPIKAKYLVAILIAIDLFGGVGAFSTGIAHFAHLGGALFGFLLMLYFKKQSNRIS